jgi:DUF4097 and DUF4098 domain-containing protein YvlB
MSRWLIFSLGLVGLIVTGCQSPFFKATEPVNLTLPWQDYQAIEVEVPNGSVELLVTAGGNIQISGERSVRGTSPQAAKENLKKFGLYAGTNVQKPSELLVKLNVPQALSDKSAQANLQITLPQGVRASLVAGNGAVRVKGMQQRITVRASNGAVDVQDVVGELDVEAGNGAIGINGALGNVRVVAGNGNIEAVNVAGNCDLRSGNGRIFADLKPAASGHVSISTGNGRIELVLPPGLGLDLDLQAANGKIETHLADQAGGMAEHRRWPHGAEVVEHVQGGGCRIDLQSGNGSITVRSRR